MDPYRRIRVALEQGCMEALKRADLCTYIYIVYKQHYYLGSPIVTDSQFDEYEDMLREYQPDNPALDVVGLIYPTCRCCRK